MREVEIITLLRKVFEKKDKKAVLGISILNYVLTFVLKNKEMLKKELEELTEMELGVKELKYKLSFPLADFRFSSSSVVSSEYSRADWRRRDAVKSR